MAIRVIVEGFLTDVRAFPGQREGEPESVKVSVAETTKLGDVAVFGMPERYKHLKVGTEVRFHAECYSGKNGIGLRFVAEFEPTRLKAAKTAWDMMNPGVAPVSRAS